MAKNETIIEWLFIQSHLKEQQAVDQKAAFSGSDKSLVSVSSSTKLWEVEDNT